MLYSKHWPHLAEVTDGFVPCLVTNVGLTLETYSTDVRNEYAEYIGFIEKYNNWVDNSTGKT